jgi:hypothetical protein
VKNYGVSPKLYDGIMIRVSEDADNKHPRSLLMILGGFCIERHDEA